MANEVTGSTHEICYWEELPCGIYSVEFKISNENAHLMKEGLFGVVQKHRWRNPHLTRVISWDRLLVDPKVEHVIPIQASQLPLPACSLSGTCYDMDEFKYNKVKLARIFIFGQ